MDMSSEIAFERAMSKANRIPVEKAAIAPAGEVAYAHGVAQGEKENRAEAFAADLDARKAAAAEKGREFTLSGEERVRQATSELAQRYDQTVKELTERERTFGVRLSASGSQFDRRIAAEESLQGKRLAESGYESSMSRGQKLTQFEQELAFSAYKFDEQMSFMRQKFDETLSFSDQAFMDKIGRQRRDLDTWIMNNRIGAVIQLANTAVSAYGNKKALDERKAMRAEMQDFYRSQQSKQNNLATAAAVNRMIDQVNNAYNTKKYEYSPTAIQEGKYFIVAPTQTGTMNVSFPLLYSDFAKSYDRMRITQPDEGLEFLTP